MEKDSDCTSLLASYRLKRGRFFLWQPILYQRNHRGTGQAEVAASLAHLLAYHDPRRLKICANTNCLGIFYDESKSRTKLYCTPEKCANLMKARRYRARHKK